MLSRHKDSARHSLLSTLDQFAARKTLFAEALLMIKLIGVDRKTSESLCDFDLLYFESCHDPLERDFIEKPLEFEGGIREGVGKGDKVVFIG